MTLRISVRGHTRAMTRDLTRVQRRIVPRVTSQALNRTAAKVRTESVREIAARKQIIQKIIRGRIRITRASPRRLRAIVIALLAGVRLIDTGKARQTASGVRVGSRSVRSAFLATMPSGHRGAFKRKGRSRLPIKEETVPIQPEAGHIIGRHVIQTGGPFFRREFERLLAVRLKRR